MARAFLCIVDVSNGQLVLPLQTDPVTPLLGELWVNAGALKYRDNSGSPTTHIVEVQDNRNVNSGYAGLNASGQVAVAQGGTGVTTANANVILAGPTSGGAGAYSFRLLVAADIPALDASKITTGTLAVAQGGTGAATAVANVVLAGPTSGGSAAYSFRALVAADIPALDASKITTGVLPYAQIADAWKVAVQAVATAVVTISAPGTTLDGYTLVSGDRILLTGQATASQNGLWIFNGSAAALTRPTDYAAANTAQAFRGMMVYVNNGTTNAGTTWQITTTGAITVDTTATAWARVITSLTLGVTGILGIANGGTTFGTYALGDIIYASATNVLSKLAANASATQMYLAMTSSVPGWVTPPGVFTGATSIAAGTTGLVPQPAAGQQAAILFGNSTWRTLTATTTQNDIPTTLLFGAVAAPGSPAEGNFWNDSTQKCLTAFVDGLKQFDTRTIFINTATQTITNTTTETTMFNSTGALGTLTLPANFLVVGKTIRIKIMGTLLRGAVTNFQFRLYLGGVLVSDSTATSTLRSTGSPTFVVDAMIRCLTTGATGTVAGQLVATWIRQQGRNMLMFGDGATTSATVNTTGTLAINATFTMSGANAGNTMNATHATVEVLG